MGAANLEQTGFIMKICEIVDLFEANLKPVQNGADIPLMIDIDHVRERMFQRGISKFQVMGILDDLGRITDQLWDIELGHRVWIFSRKHNMSISMHRYGKNAFTSKTVVRGKPYDGDKPILEIPA